MMAHADPMLVLRLALEVDPRAPLPEPPGSMVAHFAACLREYGCDRHLWGDTQLAAQVGALWADVAEWAKDGCWPEARDAATRAVAAMAILGARGEDA
jgi:hypothetical protein